MPPSELFFSGWAGPVRIIIIGTLAYCYLVLILRVTGKRTLSKLNAFDLVITVAMGSTLATAITSKDLPLVDGIFSLGLLVFLQFVVTFSSVRMPWFRRVITSEPTLLLRSGQPLYSAMVRERVTEDELRASVRGAGAERLEDAEAVFLEPDGSLTTILRRH